MLSADKSLAPVLGKGLVIAAFFSRRGALTKGSVMLNENCGIGTLVPI
jgi:hypothetical protein